MDDIDPSHWPRVGGTQAGSYHEVEADILVAVPHPGYEQTIDGARASLEEIDRITRDKGRRQALIILVDRVKSQDTRSRRLWQREVNADLVCAVALVAESLLARAIGSFFVGVYRPAVATKLVASFDEALEWARAQLKENGGPIGR